MTVPVRSPLAAVFLVLSAALPQPAVAQTDEPVAGRFEETTAVTAIEIPVRVLARGEPVAGLGIDDFVVTSGGEEQPIVALRRVETTIETASGGRAGPGPNAGDDAEAEPRRFLMLFDLASSRRSKLLAGLAGARRFLDFQLADRDQVALASYTASRGSQLLVGSTADRRAIHLGLDLLEALVVSDVEAAQVRWQVLAGASAAANERDDHPLERSRRLRALADQLGPEAAAALVSAASSPLGELTSEPSGSGLALNTIESFDDGEVITDDTFRSVLAADYVTGAELAPLRSTTLEIAELALLLREMPAPKHLLFFSESLGSGGMVERSPQARTLLGYLAETLTRSGWTLHAVDLSGIPETHPGGGGGAAFDSGGLAYVSRETGGDLMENFNRIGAATDRISERTRVSYVLTLAPKDLPADGRYRSLDVRLAPGVARERDLSRVRVLHRSGFFAPKPERLRSPLEQHMDTVERLLGDEENDALGVTLKVAPPSEPATGENPVRVEVLVDGARLAAPVAERRTESDLELLELEVYVYAIDSAGGVRDLFAQTLSTDLDQLPDELSASGFRASGILALPPGSYRLRTLVRDRSTGRETLRSDTLFVPRAGGGAPDLG